MTARKRALFLVITDLPGGAERVIFGLASGLAAKKDWEVEVKVLCTRAPDSFSGRTLPDSVKVSYGIGQNSFVGFALLAFRLLFRRYDLVVTTHIYTNGLVSLLRRARLLRAGRLVVRESTTLFDRFGGLKGARFRLLYRAYGGEDLIIAQTGYMADHARLRLPKRSATRLRVLPNPVAVEAIRTAALEPLEPQLRERLTGRRNILFCGRLDDCKRPGAALEAFRIAAAEDRRAQLIFMGTGPLEPQVRQEAFAAGLSDRVLFLGIRTNPYPVMAMCQYGIVTSATEGFPNVLLEMMASGFRKIVVTPCSGDLEALEGVTVTRGHEIEEIAGALRSALMSSEDFAEVYRRHAESRSVASYLDQILAS